MKLNKKNMHLHHEKFRNDSFNILFVVAKIILRKSSAIKYSCCRYVAAAGAVAAVLSHSTTAKAKALMKTTTTPITK